MLRSMDTSKGAEQTVMFIGKYQCKFGGKVWCMWILTVPTLLCLFAMVILVVDLFTHELHHCPQVIPARVCISYNMPKRYVAGLWTRQHTS